jgi:hypothetical protein
MMNAAQSMCIRLSRCGHGIKITDMQAVMGAPLRIKGCSPLTPPAHILRAGTVRACHVAAPRTHAPWLRLRAHAYLAGPPAPSPML